MIRRRTDLGSPQEFSAYPISSPRESSQLKHNVTSFFMRSCPDPFHFAMTSSWYTEEDYVASCLVFGIKLWEVVLLLFTKHFKVLLGQCKWLWVICASFPSVAGSLLSMGNVRNEMICLNVVSFLFSLWSIFGALRTGAYMVYILMTKGLKQSVCDQSFYNGPVSKFWAYAFVLSKAPELGECLLSSVSTPTPLGSYTPTRFIHLKTDKETVWGSCFVGCRKVIINEFEFLTNSSALSLSSFPPFQQLSVAYVKSKIVCGNTQTCRHYWRYTPRGVQTLHTVPSVHHFNGCAKMRIWRKIRNAALPQSHMETDFHPAVRIQMRRLGFLIGCPRVLINKR